MISLALPCSITTTSPPSPSPDFLFNPRRFSTRRPVSCRAETKNNADDRNQNLGKAVDRRHLLLSTTAAALLSNASSSSSFASPISPPDLSNCSTGKDINTGQPLDVSCCLNTSPDILDYKLPPVTKMRIRPAAHLACKEYYAKYEKALTLMKELHPDDPRSFMQQAKVHCAYCNLVYPQSGDESLKLQIHKSWHFFPWHRWYMYFFERILGKLIDDPTFALPFWNWDNPDGGMIMPWQFTVNSSPLFDELRNQAHLPPALVDLAYSPDSPTKPENIVSNNLAIMYSEMVRNDVAELEDFYGSKYVVGTPPDPGAGPVEHGSHTAVHVWVGQNSTEKLDMGNFYSTGRDPLFYSHHTNIDRLWSIWRELRGCKEKDFSDSDWLEADYVFYDENKNLVRVKNEDALENERMGYVYQDVDIPWLNNRPKPRVRKSKVAESSAGAPKTVFPVKLDKVVKVLVDRPKKSRSKDEEEEELLVIEGIEVDSAMFVKFDVFINDEDDKPDELDKAEYAGCYSQVPHKNSMKVKTKIRLSLSELLEDLDTGDDDKILVSLVPKAGGGDIIIGGIKIIRVRRHHHWRYQDHHWRYQAHVSDR